MKTLSVLFFLTLALFPSCKLAEDVSYEFEEIKLSEKTATLIKSENNFGVELFKNMYKHETKHENIMVSPLSVSLALAMTYNGANGETKTAMEKALRLHGLSTEEINESYYNLMNALTSLDVKVQIELANAIYHDEGFHVEENFVSSNNKYYNALVTPLDFGNQQQSLQTINGWVKEKTHDKITSILDGIEPDQVMFLLNAIYFKGIWQTEFNKESTKPFPFTTGKGETVQAATMQKTDVVPYYRNDLFSAITLNYGKGNYNMIVFLPNEGNDLNDLTESLDAENWESWVGSLNNSRKVAVRLPRFGYAYEKELNDVLTDMGMGIAFTGDADFSGISTLERLLIDFVRHKTFIEVNEEGTEAAAVTAVGMRLVSVGPDDPIPFIVDKPFMYAITEKSTGAVLFMGTVKNPLLD